MSWTSDPDSCSDHPWLCDQMLQALYVVGLWCASGPVERAVLPASADNADRLMCSKPPAHENECGELRHTHKHTHTHNTQVCRRVTTKERLRSLQEAGKGASRAVRYQPAAGEGEVSEMTTWEMNKRVGPEEQAEKAKAYPRNMCLIATASAAEEAAHACPVVPVATGVACAVRPTGNTGRIRSLLLEGDDPRGWLGDRCSCTRARRSQRRRPTWLSTQSCWPGRSGRTCVVCTQLCSSLTWQHVLWTVKVASTCCRAEQAAHCSISHMDSCRHQRLVVGSFQTTDNAEPPASSEGPSTPETCTLAQGRRPSWRTGCRRWRRRSAPCHRRLRSRRPPTAVPLTPCSPATMCVCARQP